MTSSGAYEDEMGRFLRLSDEELSRLLAGEASVRDEALDEVASLLDEVRKNFAATGVDEETRSRHMASLVETSQLTVGKSTRLAGSGPQIPAPPAREVRGQMSWRRVMKRTTGLVMKGAVGAAAASIAMVGLAYAGVDLPGQAAEKALEAVSGLDLPNQDPNEGKSVADGVHAVNEGSLEGCEKGQAVAGAATANSRGEGTNDNDPCADSTPTPTSTSSVNSTATPSAGEKSVSDEVHAVQDGDLEGCEKGQAISDAADANSQGKGTNDNDPCERDDAQSTTASGEEKSAKGRDNAAANSDGRSESGGSSAGNEGGSNRSEKSNGKSGAQGFGSGKTPPGRG